MRKIYALIVSVFVVGTAMAQRTVDLSVEEILSPTTEVASNTSSGTPFSISVAIKNNGPDDIAADDTIFIQVIFANESNQVIFAAPSTTTLSPLKAFGKTLANGDTMHVNFGINYSYYTKSSINAKLQVLVVAINRSANGLVTESSTVANNAKIQNIIWRNPQGWGVGISDVNSSDMISVYPNPASDNITVEMNVISVSQNSVVEIFDLQGKLVKSVELAAGTINQSIDISDLSKGMYIVKMTSGDISSQQKLQVVR
ncbi:MAG: T9SS type A sorting domain-containing protein [Bacteroidetes bacterium]|nr:T9SS type A sorting domain-containing protein [Bacteroidota bacterium]